MSLLDSAQLPLPSSSSSSSSHRNKQSAATSRQSRSCKVCRLRKVKVCCYRYILWSLYYGSIKKIYAYSIYSICVGSNEMHD